MPRFLVDAQLPPAIARKPTAMGHETVHVLDVGLLDADDSRIWDYALANGVVIITKEEDFAIRASVNKTSPAIVWVRIGNCPNTNLLAWFERVLATIIAMLKSGSQLVEISG